MTRRRIQFSIPNKTLFLIAQLFTKVIFRTIFNFSSTVKVTVRKLWNKMNGPMVFTLSIFIFNSLETLAVPVAWTNRKRNKLSVDYNKIPSGNWYHDETKRSVDLEELLNEPKTCSQHPSTDFNSDVMDRALCPWEWRLNRDDNREPKIITEAKCLCRRSRSLTAADCVPIKRDISVLKRVLVDDVNYEYKKYYETVTVGCHSVMPRTKHALPEFLTRKGNV